MKRLLTIVLLGAALAACSGGPTADSAIDTGPDALAPDFTLELADGGEFVLSEQTRPTYLVFWAEW